jgi:hypothetical protein
LNEVRQAVTVSVGQSFMKFVNREECRGYNFHLAWDKRLFFKRKETIRNSARRCPALSRLQSNCNKNPALNSEPEGVTPELRIIRRAWHPDTRKTESFF